MFFLRKVCSKMQVFCIVLHILNDESRIKEKPKPKSRRNDVLKTEMK